MTKYHAHLAISSAALATVIGLILFVVLPSGRQILKIHRQIQTDKTETGKFLSAGRSLEQTQKNLDLVTSENHIINDIFLYPGQELKFIEDLEKKAARNHLEQVIDFDNSDAHSQNTAIKIVPLRLELNGTLPDLIAYINDLETLDYYIIINSLNINGSTGSNIKTNRGQIESTPEQKSDKIISATINASTYWK